MTAREKLERLINTLPDGLIGELVDFAEFLERKSRNLEPTQTAEHEKRRELVYSLAGKYRDVLVSTDEFMQRKQEEIAREG